MKASNIEKKKKKEEEEAIDADAVRLLVAEYKSHSNQQQQASRQSYG